MRSVTESPGRASLTIDSWETVSVRVAFSPMHTVMATLFEIVAGYRRGVVEQWVQTVLHRAHEIDLTPFELYSAPTLVAPNFMTLSLHRLDRSFDDRLAQLRDCTSDRIVADIRADHGDDVPDAFAPWLEDPQGELQRYCHAVAAWWERVIRPSWERLSVPLHAEVARISRILAGEGARPALEALHPRLIVSDDGLTTPWERRRHLTYAIDRRPIILVPMAAGPDALLTSMDHPDGVLLGYAAPGMADALAGRDDPPIENLVQLLGPARARILSQLDAPKTNQQLAVTLTYAQSTVSEHLGSLTLMGLVRSYRLGRFVYHEKTERGAGLLELYAG